MLDRWADYDVYVLDRWADYDVYLLDRWADYDVYVLDRWADWGIFRIGDLRLLGEITDCRRNHDQPSLFAAPWAERLHYQPTTNWCPSDTLVEW